MDITQKRLQLFMREKESGTLLPTEKLNLEVVNSDEYINWLSTKREIILDDIADTHWIKTCTAGYITEVIFHANGQVDEFRLFDRFHTHGRWQLTSGVLQVWIVKENNEYHFNILGNQNVNIHSAIEYKNDEIHSYLKLAQVK